MVELMGQWARWAWALALGLWSALAQALGPWQAWGLGLGHPLAIEHGEWKIVKSVSSPTTPTVRGNPLATTPPVGVPHWHQLKNILSECSLSRASNDLSPVLVLCSVMAGQASRCKGREGDLNAALYTLLTTNKLRRFSTEETNTTAYTHRWKNTG